MLNGKTVLKLTVAEGPDKPYLSSGKAYRRTDTSTVAVDRSELRRLSIEGSDTPFDDMAAFRQDLTFDSLRRALEASLGIDVVADSTLKTLGLLREGSFTNAALALSDQNTFPGLEIVRYAQDGLSIHERLSCENVSVLDQMDAAVTEFRRNFIVERVRGMRREHVETIPEESFREALANAVVHRLLYANARIVVALHPDRIDITSPGGLPADIDEAAYLAGDMSVPRNGSLAYVFLRLGLIERLGSGVRRIRRPYAGHQVAPTFLITDSSIKVTLPTIDLEASLDANEAKLLSLFRPGLELSASELEKGMGLSRPTTLRIVASLREKGALQRVGAARATRYRLP